MNRQELAKSLRTPPGPTFAERHYRPKELAAVWGVSPKMVYSIFRHEPGVAKIGQHGSDTKRAYTTMLIPASVAERVYASWHAAS